MDFPHTPITVLYKMTGKLFTPVMIIGQMVIPFYVAYIIINIKEGSNEKKNKYFYITIYNVNTCSHRLPASETRNHITR